MLARIADAIELDWIPRPWGEELAAELRQAAEQARESVPWRQVERQLGPVSDELEVLEHEPARVTPSAQVHRGVLDGAPVAVKVLRPGLPALVRQDLALLEGLLAPLSAAFPALDAGAVLAEVRERTLEELDLEHEAGMQRRFHRAARRHPFIVVPAPVTGLSHDTVLVSEWVEGVPLREAPNADRAAAQLVVFGFGALRMGLAHADPVPDDVLVLDGGRLAILDFGATRVVSHERTELVAAAVEAFADDDAERLGAALADLGAAPREIGQSVLELVRHALGELAGAAPSRLDGGAVIAARDRLLSRPDALGGLLRAGRMPPEDLWPARGVAELFGTIARAGATGPWLELVQAALRDGWNATLPPG